MGEVLRQVEQSPGIREFLQARIPKVDGPGCVPNCKLILEDLELHDKLTGWPKDSVGAPMYPVESKLIHLILEFGEAPPSSYKDTEDLASVVMHLWDTREERRS